MNMIGNVSATEHHYNSGALNDENVKIRQGQLRLLVSHLEPNKHETVESLCDRFQVELNEVEALVKKLDL